MASNDISILVEAQDKASAALQQIGNNVDRLADRNDDASRKTDRFSSSLTSFGNVLKTSAEAFFSYQLIQGVESLTSGFVKASGELEQTNMSFQSLIGNTQVANQLFGQLVQYANVTPFQSKDVTSAAKTLLAFGQAASDVTGTVKQLGDVVSAGGGDLQALSLVSGQIFAQGKLRAQDMYQVINDGGAGLVKLMADQVGGMQNLTAEFDSGGIPAQQYFDALQKATAQGGFAFQGAQKQAHTLNGEFSTLQDSATQFGEALLGVHTDPQLGLQVQPGGLFDRMKRGVQDVSNVLQNWEPAAQRVVPQLLDKLHDLGDRIDKFLGPSFQALWKTIKNDLLPALSDLWHNIIEPLLPVIGAALAGAVWLATNALNILLAAASPLIKGLADGNPIVWLLVAAFGGLAAALAINKLIDSVNIAFNILRLVTIPGLMANVEALDALLLTPIVMPAIAVGAALASIALVYAKGQETLNLLTKLNQQEAQDNDSTTAGLQSIINSYKSGKISKAEEQKLLNGLAASQAHALGTDFAPGGLSLVGERGPELVSLPTGSKVLSSRDTQRVGRGSGKSVHIDNFHVHNDVDANAVIRKIGFQLAAA